MNTPLKRAQVSVGNNDVGDVLAPNRPEPSVFVYHHDVLPSEAVSVTMPVISDSYSYDGLHPIFAQNLPEGYLGDVLRKTVSKIFGSGDLTLLAALSRHQVGRVSISSNDLNLPEIVDDSLKGESLENILSASHPALFEDLVAKYALHSGISGVQPKVVVPATAAERSTLKTGEFIVKSWADDYPQLAANEFFCMIVAKDAGLIVPDFELSDDGRLLVMSRFDRTEKGEWLGFEDGCVLQGLLPEDKYSGSYERLAKSMNTYLSPQHRHEGMRQLFGSLVVSWAVGNGDAHLKNFGIVYEKPFEERWLAPVYDIVSTLPYLKHDVPALTLGGRKAWWKLSALETFGRVSCGLSIREVKSTFINTAKALRTGSENIQSYKATHAAFNEVGMVMQEAFLNSAQALELNVSLVAGK